MSDVRKKVINRIKELEAEKEKLCGFVEQLESLPKEMVEQFGVFNPNGTSAAKETRQKRTYNKRRKGSPRIGARKYTPRSQYTNLTLHAAIAQVIRDNGERDMSVKHIVEKLYDVETWKARMGPASYAAYYSGARYAAASACYAGVKQGLLKHIRYGVYNVKRPKIAAVKGYDAPQSA